MTGMERMSSATDSNVNLNSSAAVTVVKAAQSNKSYPALENRTLNAPATSGEGGKFGLLDLPAEIWVMIGKMVIDDSPARHITYIDICDKDSYGEMHQIFRDQESGGEQHSEKGWVISCFLAIPAVLQTCSALRNELRGGYYRDKITVAVPYHYDPIVCTQLGRYLRMIGPHARRSIRPAVCDDGWITSGRESPASPPWNHMADWEVEMMVVPRRTKEPDGDVDPGFDTMEYVITFL